MGIVNIEILKKVSEDYNREYINEGINRALVEKGLEPYTVSGSVDLFNLEDILDTCMYFRKYIKKELNPDSYRGNYASINKLLLHLFYVKENSFKLEVKTIPRYSKVLLDICGIVVLEHDKQYIVALDIVHLSGNSISAKFKIVYHKESLEEYISSIVPIESYFDRLRLTKELNALNIITCKQYFENYENEIDRLVSVTEDIDNLNIDVDLLD